MRKTMRKKTVGAIATKGVALLVVLGTAHRAMAQEAAPSYPEMASARAGVTCAAPATASIMQSLPMTEFRSIW